MQVDEVCQRALVFEWWDWDQYLNKSSDCIRGRAAPVVKPLIFSWRNGEAGIVRRTIGRIFLVLGTNTMNSVVQIPSLSSEPTK